MNRKPIFTALLVCVTLYAPLALWGQDFELNTVLVKYRGNAANVTIPEVVTTIGEDAFRNNKSVTSLTIPASVTDIKNLAFFNCTSLTSINVDIKNNTYSSVNGIVFNKHKTVIVRYPEGKKESNYTIPSSVTSIGDGAFRENKSITSVIIPTSVTTIKDFAFFDCTNLTDINIPTNVTTIGWSAFRLCKNLASVTIPSSVTSIDNFAFMDCTSLTSVTIPANVNSIGNDIFNGCESLAGINVDNQNKNYSSVDGVMFNKNSTRLIKYPEGKQGSNYTIPMGVTSIEYNAFRNCNSLTSVTIPESVTSIVKPNGFFICVNLRTVTVSRKTKIGDNTFPDGVRFIYSD